MYKYEIKITSFENTNRIPLAKLYKDFFRWVVSQMHYFIDNTLSHYYLNRNLLNEGRVIDHSFKNISSNMICNI